LRRSQRGHLAAAAGLGRPRSALDTIIAAVAEANGCIVVTSNEKDFAGAQMLNPLKPA
jgi:predicted nucleic acid-binding protein